MLLLVQKATRLKGAPRDDKLYENISQNEVICSEKNKSRTNLPKVV